MTQKHKSNYWLVLMILLTGCADTFRMSSFSFKPFFPYRLIERLENSSNISNISSKHYAILIAGNAEDRHKNNLALAYQVLLEQGYNKQDIYIFDSSGVDTPVYPLTDQASLNSIYIMFNWLTLNVNKNDTVLLYMTGHGTKIGTKSAYMLNKVEILFKKDFEELILKINPKLGIVFSDFCYWGPTNNNLELSEFVFINVADDNHVSAGTMFAREFWKSFRKKENQSLMDAFNIAYEKDIFSSKKRINKPRIVFFENNPEHYNLLGEN